MFSNECDLEITGLVSNGSRVQNAMHGSTSADNLVSDHGIIVTKKDVKAYIVSTFGEDFNSALDNILAKGLITDYWLEEARHCYFKITLPLSTFSEKAELDKEIECLITVCAGYSDEDYPVWVFSSIHNHFRQLNNKE